jgi:hypothetical protein
MMRVPIRNTLELCLVVVTTALSVALDAFLLGIFKAHIQRAISVRNYRPVYLRSGRRNRVRC